MAWTDIDPYEVAEWMTADHLNTFRDNLEYLLTPNFVEYQHPGTGSNYTVIGVAGGAPGVDVDSTNFKLSLVTNGGPVIVGFYGVVGCPAGALRMNIVRQETITYAGRNLFNNFEWEFLGSRQMSIGGMVEFPDLPAGTHEFRLVWAVGGVGTATMYAANRPTMYAVGW